ncbi:MAG: hypothetical protein JSV89_15920 [Spirochaetaceae bacterium]|nr:MAG: hypothetical protein JSV89_15920 [Spirochaetaceae bacterium]
MRAVLLAAALFTLGGWPLLSQSALIESIFLPPRFFVGDSVELRLTYEIAADVEVEVPARLPVHPWIEFQNIEVQDRREAGRSGEVLVRMFFIPFYSGQTVLPSLRLGELDTGELQVGTQSVLDLEANHSLRGLRRQLNLPLTWLRLLMLVVIVVGAPLGLYFLIRYGIRGVERIRQARWRRMPYQHVRKSLNQLARGQASMEGKSFFILLSLTVRRYLTERLTMPLMSVTTGEILKELNSAGLDEAISRRIHEVLQAADLIKFSGKRANRREMEKSLKDVDRIVRQVEERTTDVAV